MRTTSSSSSSSYSSSIFLRRHRNRCRLRCKSENNNSAELKMKTTTAFFLLPLHRQRQNEDTRARRRRRRSTLASSSSSSSSSKREEDEMMMQSDWLDSSQELDLFNADEERRRRGRGRTAKMKSDESFFLTAEEEERVDFLSITSEEIRKARAFVEPEMKRGFAKNIFESATEMREMLEESDGGREDVFSSSVGGVRAAANDDEDKNEEENRRRRRQQRRRREEEERSLRRSDLPFVLKQVFKAFSYVTNAIVSALESVVPYQIPSAAIRWSVYGVWVLLAVSSAQRFLVLLACTGGVLLLFGALNAGLNGNFSRDRYGGRSDDGGNRRRRQRSAANTKRRDFDANRRAYTRGSQYRTRSNPRWGKGDNRNASSTMNDELMDLEIPFTDFVSENLNRAAQFGGDALRDLGLSFDEDEVNYSRARKPSSEKSATTLTSINSRKIGKEEDNGSSGDFIDVTLEKQTQDSSSFTVGYREWLEESGTKNGSGSSNSGSSSSSSSTKDIKDESSGDGIKTEFIFNREEDKEREEKVAYEADTISYAAAADDDVEGYDDDEIFFDYADYEDERNDFNSSTYGGRFDRESSNDDAFIEDDFIEPVVRRLRQTAGRSFNWFNEFLTGRFYGAFQEDRVEAYAPPPEGEEQELNGGEKQQRDGRRGKEEVGEENAYERGRGGSATR